MSRTPAKIVAGKRLRQARQALGYRSRRTFANLTGVPEANLEKWENGDSFPNHAYLGKLKNLFGITFDWVLDADPSGLPHALAVKVIAAEEPD